VDISNAQVGITWATLDAPLIEAGGIHVDVANPFDSAAWIQQLGPTQTLFSYAMNNYWETNYKASQEGMTTFRYSLQPHGPFDAAAVARFSIERSQPLVAVPVARETPQVDSLLRLEGDGGVIVSSLKASRDGRAWMVRLFNTAAGSATAALKWRTPEPTAIVQSSPREEQGPPLIGPVTLPSLGILTIRAERPGVTP
jgi:alpha-mannosidase